MTAYKVKSQDGVNTLTIENGECVDTTLMHVPSKISKNSDKEAAIKQFPGEYTMYVDDSPMRFIHADSCSELDSSFKMKDGHTSTKVHNRYLIDAFILGVQHVRQGEKDKLFKCCAKLYLIIGQQAFDVEEFVDKFLEQEGK